MGKLDLVVNTKSKEFMFNLGVLFASGKKVRIINEKEVNENIELEKTAGYAKSFNMMIKYWQDNNFAPDIENKIEENKIFLICPVRNAAEEEKKILNDILNKYESKGFKVHFPPRNTNQDPHDKITGENTGGYNICLENAKAIASAKTIVIYYNKESTGSMFDLGVTYQSILNNPKKNFILENKFEYDKNNPIDNLIIKLLLNNNEFKPLEDNTKEETTEK